MKPEFIKLNPPEKSRKYIYSKNNLINEKDMRDATAMSATLLLNFCKENGFNPYDYEFKFFEIVKPFIDLNQKYLTEEILEFKDVVAISVSESGNHKLETADGKKHIVMKGFKAITIETENWTL